MSSGWSSSLYLYFFLFQTERLCSSFTKTVIYCTVTLNSRYSKTSPLPPKFLFKSGAHHEKLFTNHNSLNLINLSLKNSEFKNSEQRTPNFSFLAPHSVD